MSLKMAMKGKNRTELVQSTRDKKKTRTKSHVLCSTPPMVVVSSQNADNKKDDKVPIIRRIKMQMLSDKINQP